MRWTLAQQGDSARFGMTFQDAVLQEKAPKNKDPKGPDSPRFLSKEDCQALVARIQSMGFPFEDETVQLRSQWRNDVRWARNRATMAGDWRNIGLSLQGIVMNQIDVASLGAAVQWERYLMNVLGLRSKSKHVRFTPPVLSYPKSHIWSDTTYDMTNDQSSEIANQLITGAEAAGMLSAGYLSVSATGEAIHTNAGRFLYAPMTEAQCSLTVRDPDGIGSGWAGASSYDWSRINVQRLGEIALDKCLRSRNPIAIEPGRFTTILEPQATFGLIAPLFRSQYGYLERLNEESSPGLPFHDVRKRKSHTVSPWGPPWVFGGTKLGEHVLDERVSLSFDPLEPDLGVLPFTPQGDPYVPVTWVDHGILTALAYDGEFAQHELDEPMGQPNSGAFRMSGGETSIEEMISSTKRGLVVTRFWETEIVDPSSVLCTGVTRDGLWLVENGKISHPVKNLRFTESPLFVFNNIVQLGIPVPIFSPRLPAIVPPVKVLDFSFTSLIDAI